MAKLHHSEVVMGMPPMTEAVNLWYARLGPGSVSHYYPTKIALEAALREWFPDETEDQRYSRIHFHAFIRAD